MSDLRDLAAKWRRRSTTVSHPDAVYAYQHAADELDAALDAAPQDALRVALAEISRIANQQVGDPRVDGIRYPDIARIADAALGAGPPSQEGETSG